MHTLLLTLFVALSAYVIPAQAQDFFVVDLDLSRREHVPTYDCDIYDSRQDRRLCERLERRSWEDRAYAVDCREFSSSMLVSDCLGLASRLSYDDSTINCRQRGVRDEARCRFTKRAYLDGRFAAPAPVVVHRDVYVANTCSADVYDRAYARWSERREEMRRRGQRRAVIGTGVAILGAVLGNSDDRTTRNIGQGLLIGGAYVAAHGLVEMSAADNFYPHLMTGCGDYFVRETRYVTVESRRCTSVRYTERGFGSSRSYYEVRCQNSSYVTFDHYSAWDSGTTYYEGAY